MDARSKSLLKRLAAQKASPQNVDPLQQFCPEEPTPKQREFLNLDCYEALYGGAAGGGKSSTILMAALQYVHVPGYSALILRKSFADLALPGAIMDRAKSWLIPKGVQWQDRDKVFTFPSGAKIQFGYLDHADSVYRYQGSELQFLAFDELCQFREREYLYLHSRIRKSNNVDVPLRIRNATNPGGIGHRWVHARFVDPTTRAGRVFVPAKLEDNPHLNREEYLQALSNLDPITRAQLERGEWVESGEGRMYSFDRPRNIYMPHDGETPPDRFVLGVDLGASQSKPSTAFTVIGFWTHNSKDMVVLQSYKLAGMTPSSIAEEIHSLGKSYEFERIVVDAGALGKGYVEEFRQRWAIPAEAATKSNRLGYIKLLNGDLTNGAVKVDEKMAAQLIAEWEVVQWDAHGRDAAPGSEDHCSDATLYAWREAKAWLSTQKLPVPKPGTEEYAKYEEELMWEQSQPREQDWESLYTG